MARRNRGIGADEDDDDDVVHSRRSRTRISYKESESDDEDELGLNKEHQGPVKPETNDEDAYDDVNEADMYDDVNDDVPRSKRKRSKPVKKSNNSDSDFYAEDDDDDEEFSEEDDFMEKLQEKNFIATDDENDEFGDYEYGGRVPKKRKRKSRSRSQSVEPKRGRLTRGTASNGAVDEDENLGEDTEADNSIQQEIADLYDSSPDASPVKHKLRERDHKVDYTIPPPITNDTQLYQDTSASKQSSFTAKKRGRTTAKSDYRNILFPTAGPFGGSDVISVFGTNIPPGGIPIPGARQPATGQPGMTAIGQNLSDSDTSEDEIAPINGTATVTKKNPLAVKKPKGGKDKDKKKNNLSDTDPLGVDMNIDFSVVGGLDNYINQLKEMVALPLLYPELYQNFGISPPRGVLFHGPPGTGKTLMARALAASCSTSTKKITFFMRKGADCLSKWVGEAERQLRLLFEEAKNQQPSIIFFDEIDGLAPVRLSKQEQIHASIVSTLLALMDGMDNRGQVIVIGATNRPDAIDPALRRPGRFDREFYFPLPDINSRKQILKIHTRKWAPPLHDSFVEKLAELTKGYGGADLRALCTEAALNSIQRKYPQIYQTNDKLLVHPEKVKVIAKDFMNALEKIVPSSARSTSSGSAPLPAYLKPLLSNTFDEAVNRLNKLLPNTVITGKTKKNTNLEEAMYLDPTVNDADGGFSKHSLLRDLQSTIVCKPHLLISGSQGNGQQYLSAAILNYLEGFQVQTMDISSMFGDPTRTPELVIVQSFIEARRHQPSIIFIPNIDVWFQIVPHTAQATFISLLRNLKNNEKILLLGIADTDFENLDSSIRTLFGLSNSSINNCNLRNPTLEQREQFFQTLLTTLKMKPFEFINDLENRPKRKLKKLKVIQTEPTPTDKKKLKQQEYEDTKLKNVLKIKLAGLMDLFKTRYKRFKKPVIDENLLHHIFDPTIPHTNPLYEVLYLKSDDPEHDNMIKELTTGKYYYNMDLDVIEERLWNGYYSEPKQFLKDIRMIVKDSVTSGDRERILKANEMMTNAQFGIDDISTPEFAKACKEMREREVERQEQILKEYKELKEKVQAEAEIEGLNGNAVIVIPDEPLTATLTNPIIEKGAIVEPVLEKPVAEQPVIGEATIGHSVIETVPVIPNSTVPHISLLLSNGNGSAPLKQASETTTLQVGVVPEASAMEIDEAEKPAEAEMEAVVADDESSESEVEDAYTVDLLREVELGTKYQEFFGGLLLRVSENCNVDLLEAMNAKFMEIIWEDRNKWNKCETIEKLLEAAVEFERLFSR